jgi:hypothetical protein
MPVHFGLSIILQFLNSLVSSASWCGVCWRFRPLRTYRPSRRIHFCGGGTHLHPYLYRNISNGSTLTCEGLWSAEVNTTMIPRFLSNYEPYPPASGLRSPRSEHVGRNVNDNTWLRHPPKTVCELRAAERVRYALFHSNARDAKRFHKWVSETDP